MFGAGRSKRCRNFYQISALTLELYSSISVHCEKGYFTCSLTFQLIESLTLQLNCRSTLQDTKSPPGPFRQTCSCLAWIRPGRLLDSNNSDLGYITMYSWIHCTEG